MNNPTLARHLKAGDRVKMPNGATATVKTTNFLNGSDGQKPIMTGDDGLNSAFVLEVLFEDHDTVMVHPAVEVPLA